MRVEQIHVYMVVPVHSQAIIRSFVYVQQIISVLFVINRYVRIIHVRLSHNF